MLFLGILGEYVGRTHININKKPQAVVAETTGREVRSCSASGDSVMTRVHHAMIHELIPRINSRTSSSTIWIPAPGGPRRPSLLCLHRSLNLESVLDVGCGRGVWPSEWRQGGHTRQHRRRRAVRRSGEPRDTAPKPSSRGICRSLCSSIVISISSSRSRWHNVSTPPMPTYSSTACAATAN